MLRKKIITSCLVIVLLLQLLPVRQAIMYFFIDNVMAEEIVDINKSATKNFRLLDEDHGYIFEMNHGTHFHNMLKISLAHLFDESIPAFHVADILTPPPNLY